MTTLRHRKQNHSESGNSHATASTSRTGGDTSKDPNSTTQRAMDNNNNGSEDQSSVSSEQQYCISILKERSAWARLDVAPFFVLYSLCIGLDIVYYSYQKHGLWIFGICILLHITLVLLTQWKMSVKVWVGYSKLPMQRIREATHCYVQQRSNIGAGAGKMLGGEQVNDDHRRSNRSRQSRETPQREKDDIVPMIFDQTSSSSQEDLVASIHFHDIVFRYTSSSTPTNELNDRNIWTPTPPLSPQSETFQRLYYPDNLPISFYMQWKGHSSIDQSRKIERIYGNNTTVLKLPTFFDLLSEQLVAPFFLFQVFCVALWSLDEYWYYAIMTLVSLLIFESTLAFNRLKGLERLHHAGHKGNDRIWVRRGSPLSTKGSWMTIYTKELLPGDFVSLTSSGNGTTMVPADIVIVSGSAVADEALLTGESVPQIKQAIHVHGLPETTKLDTMDGQLKESVLFGGTSLLVTNGEDGESSGVGPEKGVCGVVLRTGFETAQGNLLRTMAYSAKNADSVHTWDTFIFIAMLVVCAVCAASLVLREGWHDERRNQFRLLLHVVMIITSVVPPELPMELSLAITNSVSALVRKSQVYCTELFRIPWAGEIDVCCFDKTGTITSDEMLLRGVRLFGGPNDLDEEDQNLTTDPDNLPHSVRRIMASCQSLAVAGPTGPQTKVVGDPLEIAVLEGSGFKIIGKGMLESDDKSTILMILHRFAFSSKQKRMSAMVAEKGKEKICLVTKGAPETIKELLVEESIPAKYDQIAAYHMRRGRRVLAMGYKELGTIKELPSLKTVQREAIEKELTFAGLLVLECPLKPDSKTVITELRKSEHRVVMITGDALLTACEVSRLVTLIPKTAVKCIYRIRGLTEDFNQLQCTQLLDSDDDESSHIQLSLDEACSMVRESKAAFCLEGSTLLRIALLIMGIPDGVLESSGEKDLLLRPPVQAVLCKIVPCVSVFGRHTPYQKEAVVSAFNRSGSRTLMVGDGTNDVGALKRAHVGISIVSAPEVESKQRKANEKLKKARKNGKTKGNNSMETTLRELREAQEELDFVELGDASVAAPFTSRSVSIKCCRDVIQQGRCTLVTMLQIYKILGINCLVNAMVLSNLFLQGVKQGDRQLTALGLVVAALFFFLTRSEPVAMLAKERPPSSVLSMQALLTIVGQFVVHMVAISVSTHLSALYVDPFDPSLVPDGPFNPNILNSTAFLLTCLVTVNTFAVNYRGRPFMRDLQENKLLYRSLQACYVTIAVCLFDIFPPLNDLLQLSAFPQGQMIAGRTASSFVPTNDGLLSLTSGVTYPVFLAGLMCLDTFLCFGVERAVRRTIKA